MGMKTVAIVQARLGSSRLPGKILKPLLGRSILLHVLDRCKKISGVDSVCCATTDNPEDDAVADEAAYSGYSVFRGDENDVLKRYLGAARSLDAQRIVRVTSDCPLIDPAVSAQVLDLMDQSGVDYACNNQPPEWPHGLDTEAFTRDALERTASEARKPSEREHVTPYMRSHESFIRRSLPGPKGEAAQCRWTIDTPADLEFFKALFPLLPAGPEALDWQVVFEIVQRNPHLTRLNSGQDRFSGLKNSLAEDNKAGFGIEVDTALERHVGHEETNK